MKHRRMTELQLLAAETYAYSYANYADHLGVNPRFDRYMPENIEILEKLTARGGSVQEIAEALEIDPENAESLLTNYLLAKEVVLVDNAVESFRVGVKQSVLNALEEGLATKEDVDGLVDQICYRVADLAYLLEREQSSLADYSEILRE